MLEYRLEMLWTHLFLFPPPFPQQTYARKKDQISTVILKSKFSRIQKSLSANYAYALKLITCLERCGKWAILNQHVILVCTLMIPEKVTPKSFTLTAVCCNCVIQTFCTELVCEKTSVPFLTFHKTERWVLKNLTYDFISE